MAVRSFPHTPSPAAPGPAAVLALGAWLTLVLGTGCGGGGATPPPADASAGPCTPGAEEACGDCGKRACAPDGVWGDCAGEGPCSPGTSIACGAGGTMTCDDACAWLPCTAPCTASETAACGNCGTMTCGADGTWGLCAGAGPCVGTETEACTACSARACVAEICQWGACVGSCQPGSECRGDTCTPCGTVGLPCCGGECQEGLICGGEDGATCVSPLPTPDGGPLDAAAPPADAAPPPPDGGPACVFPPRDAAIALYYGTIKDNDGTQRPDLTYQLYDPGIDTVFTIGGGSIFLSGEPSAPGQPGTGAFKEYHEQCLRLASHIGTGQFASCVRRRSDLVDDEGRSVNNPCEPYRVAGGTGVDDLVAYWKHKLDLGWDYIALDEVKTITMATSGGGSILVNFKDGGTESNRFEEALTKLAALGYDRRVIVFFVPHDADGPPPSLPEYTNVLRACRDHCRTLQLELYYQTTEIEAGKASNFNRYATALHNLGITNINRHVTAIIAVGNDVGDGWYKLDHDRCDISPWNGLTCPALPGSGGVHKQLLAMHQGEYSRYWWGVGFYKIGAVRSKTGFWTKEDFVQSTRERVHWWATHDPP